MQQDFEFKYSIRKDFPDYPTSEDYTHWKDICRYLTEHFGNPGDKYITYVDIHYMTFIFKNEVDCIQFILACL